MWPWLQSIPREGQRSTDPRPLPELDLSCRKFTQSALGEPRPLPRPPYLRGPEHRVGPSYAHSRDSSEKHGENTEISLLL